MAQSIEHPRPGDGVFPFDTSNEAYKLGVNYVISAATH